MRQYAFSFSESDPNISHVFFPEVLKSRTFIASSRNMRKLRAPRKQEKHKQIPPNYECKPARGFCFSQREYSKGK